MISSIHNLFTAAILAQAPTNSLTSALSNPMVMMGLMVFMFYFLAIRPQQKQRKEHAARIKALQNGDKVITNSGIHGLVHHIKEHTVTIKVAEATMIEFDKAAIANVFKKDSAAH